MEENMDVVQKKSIRIIKTVRGAIGLYGVLVLLGVFLYNIGFPQKVEETVPAVAIMENGEVTLCNADIQGEVTRFLLKNPEKREIYTDKDSVTVCANGKRVGIISYRSGNERYVYGSDHRSVCILSRTRDVLLAETDAQWLFPEQENRRCIVIAPAGSEDEALTLLREQEIPEQHAEKFLWLLSK